MSVSLDNLVELRPFRNGPDPQGLAEVLCSRVLKEGIGDMFSAVPGVIEPTERRAEERSVKVVQDK